ncbi:type II toxin-antitoxin system HicA family toxin [Enterococcus diestrammenae]|uniref:Toxin HicA n=1 Tax=Enterococcus diestrammenae TaxID=1155073 RepID=A0ABV0EYU7_9ENTE|nr:type II toxin-antitoxin system HicA family toxin [Enterococcus diestrammenae]KAF1294793.1 toxin HicA [Enterococcus diestrammenae]
MPMTPKQMVKLLKKNGFKKVSQNGSHAKYYNPNTKRTTIVAMHNEDLDKGTESAILKQAGLK